MKKGYIKTILKLVFGAIIIATGLNIWSSAGYIMYQAAKVYPSPPVITDQTVVGNVILNIHAIGQSLEIIGLLLIILGAIFFFSEIVISIIKIRKVI